MRRFLLRAAALLLATPLALQPTFAETLAVDTPAKTAAGAGFTAPEGWDLKQAGNLRQLSAPEGDTAIAIIEGLEAKDVSDAAAKAWATWRPERARPPKIILPRAPRDGWDERGVVSYETSPNEKLILEALALRKNDKWTVILLDAGEATLDKRGAAVNRVYGSLTAPGYSIENFAGKVAHKLDKARVDQLLDFTRTAMAQLQVPGVGIALIEDGKVIFEGGLGVKKVGSPEPVDAHSRFMVASNTKGMSTLMLATLVDEGKLKWDQPVTEVYPEFKLGSPETTKKVLVRHLVCACTGLPRKDFEWIFNTQRDTKPDTVFKLLGETEPTSGFGELFQYNNLITTAGGFIGGHIAYPEMDIGAAYDKAMRERVFKPLGMNETTLSFDEALKGNLASPHGLDIDGKVAVASHDLAYSIQPYRPAGGAWSSAHDMAKYAANELSKGLLPNGKRMVSESNLLERRKHGVSTGEGEYYGMGLFEYTKLGIPIVYHGGSMPGYKSNFFVFPDANVAAVILTNADDGNSMLRPFMRRLAELLYDGRPEAAASVKASADSIIAALAEERARLKIPPDPATIAKLAERYSSPELGTIKVVKVGDRVKFEFTDWSSMMATKKNDDGTTSLVTMDPSIGGLFFVVGEKDGKPVLTTRDSQHEYLFTSM
ncbi:class A beta-lactamase-related serine hydrolase [Sphingorhabdus pulchriflava]|uniref:Class A beta-lactamase-related serine hydrolase n=1 Tax=Sphingorhabdus pulchriflava TaxID=2292257 RepID=A0A371BIY1_9SPHN|nr:serine hydrolase domain-containing protein [Sphingorhabdus pulchriflava]RDV07574.1 class A beta-lactamase-related serine hydrolase [Sphingorhabdus pulchriflava]